MARPRSRRPPGPPWVRPGFTMMAVAALLATASSVNATLYASGGLTAMLAEVGQFPPFFGRGSPLGSHAGLLITSAIVLVVANVVDLSAIASVGSACSLAIFLLVGIAGYRRRADTGSHGAIVLAAIAVTAIVLVFFAIDTLRNAPETFAAIIAILLLAIVLDFIWKRRRPAAAQPNPPPTSGEAATPPECPLRVSDVPTRVQSYHPWGATISPGWYEGVSSSQLHDCAVCNRPKEKTCERPHRHRLPRPGDRPARRFESE